MVITKPHNSSLTPFLLSEFRFNRRRSERRPLLFARAIEFGMKVTGKTRRYFTEKGTMFREMRLT